MGLLLSGLLSGTIHSKKLSLQGPECMMCISVKKYRTDVYIVYIFIYYIYVHTPAVEAFSGLKRARDSALASAAVSGKYITLPPAGDLAGGAQELRSSGPGILYSIV